MAKYIPIIKTSLNERITISDWNSGENQLVKLTTPDNTNDLIVGTPPKLNSVYTVAPPSIAIVDNLTSMSTTAGLSANQGRILNDRIKAIETRGYYYSQQYLTNSPSNSTTTNVTANVPYSLPKSAIDLIQGRFGYIIGIGGGGAGGGNFKDGLMDSSPQWSLIQGGGGGSGIYYITPTYFKFPSDIISFTITIGSGGIANRNLSETNGKPTNIDIRTLNSANNWSIDLGGGYAGYASRGFTATFPSTIKQWSSGDGGRGGHGGNGGDAGSLGGNTGGGFTAGKCGKNRDYYGSEMIINNEKTAERLVFDGVVYDNSFNNASGGKLLHGNGGNGNPFGTFDTYGQNGEDGYVKILVY